MNKKQKQAAEIIKRNFSVMLISEGKYIYQDALVTVTSVSVSPDLSVAKVYLSVYNTDYKQEVILQLEENHNRIRSAMASRLKRHLRRIPRFELFLDDTLDEMYRLRNLFQRLREEHQMGEEE